jgi:large subunit ribosomal protein L1
MKRLKQIHKVKELVYELKIRDAAVTDIFTLSPETMMSEVRALLRSEKITAAPVCRNGDLLGIVSVEDYINWLTAGGPDCPVSDRMSRDLITMKDDESMVDAIKNFEKYRFYEFPVINRETGKLYGAEEAFALLKELSKVKFNESVDVAVNLGVDPRKSDQVVRGSAVLPNGIGKTVRVAVFTQGANAEAATAAGADKVGMDDLAEEVKAGNLDFDVVIASPDAMRVVGQLGKILGPRGLMPNPKVGTVTPNVADAVTNAKSGQVRYRTDKAGIIHCPLGKADFEPMALRQNLEALLANLVKAKPSAAKGVYMKRVTVSTTMGPGLAIDHSALSF